MLADHVAFDDEPGDKVEIPELRESCRVVDRNLVVTHRAWVQAQTLECQWLTANGKSRMAGERGNLSVSLWQSRERLGIVFP
jgi:hypothetical protein